ncbi:DNA-protecting protein DprA [Cryobacterium melibiosiphilum]|uniref:DNA-protecting protein DprA n=1 Tax=Cryobacterium melibiosiphilum TaxID=995039 RepID=A0A3A5M963_9MICO|nr:DNA-processing protein DprA [Cryobacterium melibiosiphilum]RJT84660.1 DNA-protecting protein DprA [Cryobacterium melibiosiphilum]
MRIFGLDEARVMALAAGVALGASGAEPPDPAAAAHIFARAAWSGIAEPGDGLAGLLVTELGAVSSLQVLHDSWTPRRISALIRERRGAGVNERGAGPARGGDEEFETTLQQGLERWRPRLVLDDVVRSLLAAQRVSAKLLLPSDPLWPLALGDLAAHTPIALWWRGTPAALRAMPCSIALVGSRAATQYGEHVAMEASAGLCDRGFAIVSGAAYGIDGMAHRAALASDGMTVAFLAGGVDRFYPTGHDALLNRITELGAVISELPCGASPTKWRFLQRNRLIAAASAATVVLEAGWRSGSLNTAGHAAALGRPLGAVPGPVTSPASAGCHRLIREYDAECVTNASEMAELAGISPHPTGLNVPAADGDAGAGSGHGRTSDQVRVFDALSARAARSVADIARRSGLSLSSVRGALGGLGLEGVVHERESGWSRTT